MSSCQSFQQTGKIYKWCQVPDMYHLPKLKVNDMYVYDVECRSIYASIIDLFRVEWMNSYYLLLLLGYMCRSKRRNFLPTSHPKWLPSLILSNSKNHRIIVYFSEARLHSEYKWLVYGLVRGIRYHTGTHKTDTSTKQSKWREKQNLVFVRSLDFIHTNIYFF